MISQTVHHQQLAASWAALLGGPRDAKLPARNADTEKETHGHNTSRS